MIKRSVFNTLIVSFILLFLALSGKSIAQKSIPKGFCITPEEKQLFNQINQMIDEYGKTELELSKSLSYVAKVHIDDLLKNHPDTSICNLSSWSDKGEWTACCHNPYIPQQDCMWDKPKELTPYPYRGYELVSYFEDDFNLDSVLLLWSDTKQVLDMILTEGNFKKKKWICMGIGLNEKYVSVWFGQRADKQGKTDICNDDTSADRLVIDSDTEAKYYIIFGSYSTTKDAKEALKQFAKNDFENAGILKSNNAIRVYLDSFSNIKEAMFYKQNLPYTYREAWIFKE